ncbi:MAG: glycosyltransferase [Candidatus Levybacteria bacterium RBG_16_35_11]|nr:MAG: glycosyltransferase [Candidatus Levybacteria bacterium RBG_16_35_11]
MKIAVIGTRGFPGVQGGVETHCEKLYTHLAENGCDITVFTRKAYVPPDLHTYKGISLVPISCPQNKFLEAFIHTFKGVLKARKLKPDILHIHAIGPSFFTPLARFIGMKVVITTQGPDYKRKKWNFLAKIFLMFCEWMGMTFANEVIAVANNISEDIKRKFARNAYVIPNGVEIPDPSDTDDILRKFDLQKKRYILTVGRFVPEKGFDYLIDAFNNGDFEGWKLVIVGSADHDDKYSIGLREKAKKNSNIVLTGFLTGKPLQEIYTHAGLFVLPSYHEGLPIVLLEAMSYGLSCIASDISANRNVELSEDRFFKAGDIKALTNKMREFINKPRGNEEIKKQISAIAEKYNWEKIAERTLEVYRAIT